MRGTIFVKVLMFTAILAMVTATWFVGTGETQVGARGHQSNVTPDSIVLSIASTSETPSFTGSCPYLVAQLYCNTTSAAPLTSGDWYGASNIANPLGLASHTGSVLNSGYYTSNRTVVSFGSHTATEAWHDYVVWSGLVSVYSGSPCPTNLHSQFWINQTTTMEVFSSTAGLVGSSTNFTPLAHAAVGTSASSCIVSKYFSGYTPAGSPSLMVPFTAPKPSGTFWVFTWVTITVVINYTGDACSSVGVDWDAFHGWPWPWPQNPGCPPSLAAPVLPPNGGNISGVQLQYMTIV